MATLTFMRHFRSATLFSQWLVASGASFGGVGYPRVHSWGFADGGGFNVLVEMAGFPAGARALYAPSRGVGGGLEVAAGSSSSADPITTTEKLFELGETEAVAVVGEVGSATNGADTTFTEDVAYWPIVPGTVDFSAPSVGDVSEGPADVTVPFDGTAIGDDLSAGSFVYPGSGRVTLDYSTAPGAGNITRNYSWDPFPGSVDVPVQGKLSRAELTYFAGTGTPVFTLNVYEDPVGRYRAPTPVLTSGPMSPGDTATFDLARIAYLSRALYGVRRGKLWLGVTADSGSDHEAALRVFVE